MAKEGKSNFELKKGKRFQFDLSKNPKRTFDLVKDIDEAPAEVGFVPTQTAAQPTVSQSVTNPQSPIAKAEATPVKGKPQPQPNTKKDATKSGKQGTNQPSTQNPTSKQPKGSAIPQQPVAPIVIDNAEESGNEGGIHKWMWIIGVILVVAIITWLCLRGCSSSNDNKAPTAPVVETVDATTATDEEAVIEEPSAEGETELPTTSNSEKTAVSSADQKDVPSGTPASTSTPSETATPSVVPAPSTAAATSASQAVGENPNRTTAASATTSASASVVPSDIEAEALKVIRGVYGTGLERKLKLGSKYRDIQNRVNELKRQGVF